MTQRESCGEIKNIEVNENKNTTGKTLWDDSITMIREEFILLNTYIRK